MNDLASAEELFALFNKNQIIDGHGIEGLKMHSPCPFCAHPHCACFRIIDTEAGMKKGGTCKNCGRSWKAIFKFVHGGKQFEIVQTGGDDPPDWMKRRPRRIDQ